MRALAVKQTEALKGAPLSSSLERSLEEHMRVAHDEKAAESVRKAYKDLYNGDSGELLVPDEEDSCDIEFWNHGVSTPDTSKLLKEIGKGKGANADQVAELNEKIVLLEKSFAQLDYKFAKRSLYLYDFRIVYAKLRAKVLHITHVHRGCASRMCIADVFSLSLLLVCLFCLCQLKTQEPIVTSASAQAKVSTFVKIKRCGCVKSKCSTASCGCTKRGEPCDDACGCEGEGSCVGGITPGLDIALTKQRARAAEAVQAKAAKMKASGLASMEM